jgi:hypothetical protein
MAAHPLSRSTDRFAVPPAAARQFGVFTRAQGLASGLSRGQVDHRIKSGLWVRVAGQAFAASTTRLSIQQGAWSMALTWPDAVLWGPSALRLARPDAPIERSHAIVCSIPWARAPQLGLQPHRLTLRPEDLTVVDGVTTQNYAAALVECLAALPKDQADHLFSWALTREWITASQLSQMVGQRIGRRGTLRLRRYCSWAEAGAASELEVKVQDVLDRCGITGWQGNVKVRLPSGQVFRVDLVFRDKKVVIEADGWRFHQGREAFEADRARTNAFTAAGYRVLRVTWERITTSPEEFIAQLKSLLA